MLTLEAPETFLIDSFTAAATEKALEIPPQTGYLLVNSGIHGGCPSPSRGGQCRRWVLKPAALGIGMGRGTGELQATGSKSWLYSPTIPLLLVKLRHVH